MRRSLLDFWWASIGTAYASSREEISLQQVELKEEGEAREKVTNLGGRKVGTKGMNATTTTPGAKV